MELLSFNIKKFQETEAPEKILIFSQKKAFLIFQETESPKKNFTFQESELSYFSLIFQEATFGARKMKKTHSEKISYISGNGTFAYFQGYLD